MKLKTRSILKKKRKKKKERKKEICKELIKESLEFSRRTDIREREKKFQNKGKKELGKKSQGKIG